MVKCEGSPAERGLWHSERTHVLIFVIQQPCDPTGSCISTDGDRVHLQSVDALIQGLFGQVGSGRGAELQQQH